MHLRRHHKNQLSYPKQPQHEHRPQAQTQQPIATALFNWNLAFLPKEVRELAAKRKALHEKSAMIECRLRFGYSKPLADYKMQLVKEDIEISCKITDYLISLPKQS